MLVRNLFFVLAIGNLLIGCGEESKNENGLSGESLTPLSGDALETGIKNGLRTMLLTSIQNTQSGGGLWGVMPVDPIQPLRVASSPADSTAPIRPEYSKYDGEYWYLATTFGRTFFDEESSNGFAVARIDTDNKNAEHIGKYIDQTDPSNFVFTEALITEPVSEKETSAVELQSRVHILSGPIPPQPKYPSILTMPEYFEPIKGYAEELAALPKIIDPKVKLAGLFLVKKNSKTTAVATVSVVSSDDTMLQIVGVKTPEAPELKWSMTIEGALIHSQQLANTLILITERRPLENGLQALDKYDSLENREAIKARNEARLNELGVQDLLTQYSIGDIVKPLTQDCLVQSTYGESKGLQKMVNITSVNLQDHSVKSVCVAGNYDVVGMSPKSVFLTGSYLDNSGTGKRQKTVVHSFALAESGAEYSATASVMGQVTAEDRDNQVTDFISVSDNKVRLVTAEPGGSNRLTLLENNKGDSGGELKAVGPAEGTVFAGIGDRVSYASYYKEKAYIGVYSGGVLTSIFDLSDNFKVTEWLGNIRGDIYPLSNDYLLAVADGRIELYDVFESPPLIVSSLSFNSNAENSRIIRVSKDEVRVIYPLTPAIIGEMGMSMLEVVGLESRTPRLTKVGEITLHTNLGDAWNSTLSSLVEGDTHYVANAPAIWSVNWGQPETLTGPLLPRPCEREPEMGVRVNLTSVDPAHPSGPLDLCGSKVTIISNGNAEYSEVLSPVLSESTSSMCVFEGALDRMGSYNVEVGAPTLISVFNPYVYVGGSYCKLAPALVTISVDSASFCEADQAPAFVMGVVTADGNQDAACNASIEFDFLDNAKYQLHAIPKSDLAPEYSALFGDDVQCVIQGPVYKGEGGEYGFDFTLSAAGYKKISAWSSASDKNNGDCLLNAKVFQATLEPLQ